MALAGGEKRGGYTGGEIKTGGDIPCERRDRIRVHDLSHAREVGQAAFPELKSHLANYILASKGPQISHHLVVHTSPICAEVVNNVFHEPTWLDRDAVFICSSLGFLCNTISGGFFGDLPPRCFSMLCEEHPRVSSIRWQQLQPSSPCLYRVTPHQLGLNMNPPRMRFPSEPTWWSFGPIWVPNDHHVGSLENPVFSHYLAIF